MDLRGWGGGVQGQILDFLCLDICCSPDYLVSKMGSFVPQVCTIAEIGRDKVGHYAHDFVNLAVFV